MTLISVDSGVTLAISMRRMLADRQWPMRLFYRQCQMTQDRVNYSRSCVRIRLCA